MIEKQRLGTEIKKWRKLKKLTQKQLASNICNQSEISRIEAGESFPSVDILNLLAIRLELPLTYFFEVLIHEEVETMKFIKNKIAIYSLNKNYLELHKYLATLLNEKPSYHPEMQKFLLWQNYIAAYYLKKIDTNYCLTELSLLLRKTTIGMDVLLDLQIKNSIANIYSENKRYTESTKIFQEILNTDFKTKEGDKLKIKVFYNFGKMLFLKKEFENSLFQTDRGIDLSIEMADMSLLGQFYYQKGAIMEELSFQFEEIASYYQRAHFFFDLIGLEFHSKIIIEKKGTFLVSKI